MTAFFSEERAVAEGSVYVAPVRANGWNLVQNFASVKELELLRNDLAEVTSAPAKYEQSIYYYEVSSANEKKLNRIERIWEAIPTLTHTSFGRRIVAVAESYFEGPVVLFKDKLNIRYAGSNGYAPHQDSAAGWDEFADRFISIGLFLAQSDRQRGGFEVVNGHHNSGRFPNDKGQMTNDLFESLGPLAIVANSGDALLLDSEAPHRTLTNGSVEDSWHLLFTFASARFGEIRNKYYNKKAQSFNKGREGNRVEFRVFAF